MSKLKINLLGPPEFFLDATPVVLGRRKSEALLAYLAVTKQAFRREPLAALLWPEASQPRAYTYLRRSLSALKQTLGADRLYVDHDTVELAETDLDLAEFSGLLATAETQAQNTIEERADLLRAATALHRGDFMAGFALPDCPDFDEWQFFQGQELRRQLGTALDDLIDLYVEEGAFDQALPFARDRLALDSYDEDTHRVLMRLYAWAGQWAAARRQFGACTQFLAAELGVEPDNETMQLYRAILSKNLSPRAPVEPSSSSSDTSATQLDLPVRLTPLIGREQELAALSSLLREPDRRLITLIGPGGIGKSRLALELADRHADQFDHGAIFVELASLENPGQLSSAIILALGLTQASGSSPAQQLTDYLRNRKLLLVLDNFEHLLAASSTVVKLLQAAPSLTALTTSRARLNVQGESVFPVDGLPLPASDEGEESDSASDSVRLFVHQARLQRPGFQLTADNLSAVNRICTLVQGMPLGILLAAGWVELFTPKNIADRIVQSLDFLESDVQDLPDRQRSLRAVFASTWAMLSEHEQEVYPCLSVFRGGWTATAGQTVAGLSIRDLKNLLDKSLVQSVQPDRFTVHELLRQYAAEILADDPTVERAARSRHATFFTEFLAEKAPMLDGPDHLATLDQIGLERENLHIAWFWAADQRKLDLLTKAVDGLCQYEKFRGHNIDGVDLCRRAIDNIDGLLQVDTQNVEALALTARLLMWQGVFHRERGDEAAQEGWMQAFSIIDDPILASYDSRRTRADLLFHQGIAAVRLCEYDQAQALYDESEILYRELDASREIADLLLEKAIVYWHKNRYDEANGLNQEAMNAFQALGDNAGISDSLMGLGLCANGQGKFEDAETYFRQCVTLAEKASGDRIYIATVRNLLGWTLINCGKFGETLNLSLSSAAIAHELGNQYWASMCQWTAGTAHIHMGSYEQADELLTPTLTLAQGLNFARGVAAVQMLLSWAALATGRLDRSRTLAQASVETSRSIDHPDELARNLTAMAMAHLGQNRADLALPFLLESLQLAHQTGANHAMIKALPAAALYLMIQNDPCCALTYHTLALKQPMWFHSRWYADVVGRPLDLLSAELSDSERSSAEERARCLTLAQAISDLLAKLDNHGAADKHS